MKYLKLLTIIFIVVLTSCDKTEKGEPCETFAEEHLIFGTYYGECIGNCALLYKIEKCQVFEDDMEYFYNTDLKFSSDALSQEKYELAESASINFPSDLWDEQETEFGIPDAYDQGGIYIERNLNGEIRSWKLDTNEEVLPPYLADYATIIKSLVLDLIE